MRVTRLMERSIRMNKILELQMRKGMDDWTKKYLGHTLRGMGG
jgi:hypothetical protein